MLATVVGPMRSERFRPYTLVWFDIVSAAAQGQAAHRAAGQEILAMPCIWIAALHPEGPAAAPRLLALVGGILVLDTLSAIPALLMRSLQAVRVSGPAPPLRALGW